MAERAIVGRALGNTLEGIVDRQDVRTNLRRVDHGTGRRGQGAGGSPSREVRRYISLLSGALLNDRGIGTGVVGREAQIGQWIRDNFRFPTFGLDVLGIAIVEIDFRILGRTQIRPDPANFSEVATANDAIDLRGLVAGEHGVEFILRERQLYAKVRAFALRWREGTAVVFVYSRRRQTKVFRVVGLQSEPREDVENASEIRAADADLLVLLVTRSVRFDRRSTRVS